MFEQATILRKQAGRRRLLSLCALIAIAALFALIIANGVRVTDERRQAERLQVHSLDVLLVTGRLEGVVNEAMRGQRGFLITGDHEFLEPYFRGRAQSGALLRRLQRLTADNPVQQAHVAILGTKLNAYIGSIDRLVALDAAGHHDQAVAAVRAREGRAEIIDFFTALRRIDRVERHLLTDRAEASFDADEAADNYNYIMAAAALIVVLLMAYAGFGAAIGHKRAIALTEELERLATTDALTGLPNRRQLMTFMEQEVRRAERTGRPLALAMLDIDRFKRINDTHGHQAGDTVLQIVSEELQKVTRGGDLLGRIGGEEFAVLMPETSLEQARWACERLRKAVSKRIMHYSNGMSGHVTVSTGIALLAGDEGSTHLIARADAALYRAKEDGRDRVRLAA